MPSAPPSDPSAGEDSRTYLDQEPIVAPGYQLVTRFKTGVAVGPATILQKIMRSGHLVKGKSLWTSALHACLVTQGLGFKANPGIPALPQFGTVPTGAWVHGFLKCGSLCGAQGRATHG